MQHPPGVVRTRALQSLQLLLRVHSGHFRPRDPNLEGFRRGNTKFHRFTLIILSKYGSHIQTWPFFFSIQRKIQGESGGSLLGFCCSLVFAAYLMGSVKTKMRQWVQN